jgi:hypothetical protein
MGRLFLSVLLIALTIGGIVLVCNIHFNPAKAETPTPTSMPAVTASLSESASALYYGNTINFTVSADGGMPPYTYTWYIDNQIAQTSASQYFSTNTQAVGSHHVYVQVTDANNNSATTLTVEFNVLPVSSTSSSLSPTPSNSPTQQSTPTSHPPWQGDPPDLTGFYIFVSIIVLAIIIIVGILVYFKRRRR